MIEILSSGKQNMKIVLFGAEWCAPCHTVRERLNNMSVDFTELDAERDVGVFNRFGVISVPTLIAIEDEDGYEYEVERVVGNSNRIEDFVKRYVK